MRVSDQVRCAGFPCAGVRHGGYAVSDLPVDPSAVSIVLVSEAAPENPSDHYYAGGDSLFARTTVQAFRDAGTEVSSLEDILGLGVYLTTAVKCGKTGYAVPADVIRACSAILERELALFPNARALLLMGDTAIRAVNAIAKRAGEERVIPAGSTYKLRGGEYFFRGMRAFPSYLQAGPAFFIEKSKRKMIAEDIAAALRLVRTPERSSSPMAYCGLPCATCPLHLLALERDPEARESRRADIVRRFRGKYALEPRPGEDIACDGCASDTGRLFSGCAGCGIRACAREKAVENCARCGEYVCGKLGEQFDRYPVARARLEAIRNSDSRQ